MPDKVYYDEEGNETGRERPVELTLNTYQGNPAWEERT